MYGGLGAYGAPTFFDANNNPVTSIACGSPYTFDVPGVSPAQIWLDQTKDGVPWFSGPFSVPMPSFTADCASQTGVYVNAVSTLNQGQRGSPIGQTTLTVLPAGATSPLATVLSGMTTTQMVALAAVGLALVLRMSKRK